MRGGHEVIVITYAKKVSLAIGYCYGADREFPRILCGISAICGPHPFTTGETTSLNHRYGKALPVRKTS